MSRESVPYGLWPSPITPARVAQSERLRDLAWDTEEASLVWLTERSDRGVLVCRFLDLYASRDLTSTHSVRARVGYGGGDMTVSHGQAYFCSEGRLYRKPLRAGEVEAITPAFGQVASPRVSPDGRWVLFVHTYDEEDCLAIVDVEGRRWPQKLVQGADFYMQPVWHPGGEHIAWVSWNHPRMPWDGTTLGMATLKEGSDGIPVLKGETVVAGSEDVSIFQPTFSPDGRHLAYVSDVSGWYNLYLYDMETGKHSSLVSDEAELARPAWAQGMRTYAWSADGKAIYYLRNQEGFFSLWSVNVTTGQTSPIKALSSYTYLSQVDVSPMTGSVAVIASSAKIPPRVLVYGPTSESVHVVAHADTEMIPQDILSEPQPISWETEQDGPVHGLLYMPQGNRYDSGGKPPLIVMVHGGPTSQTLAEYSSRVQFLATRGYAVLELNYRGSTGYGRDYRNELRGRWGIVDVDDAVSGARCLVKRGLVDEEKLVIMGGSAGGYSVLQGLIRYPGTFKAGVCLYGVTNLFTLAADTHKFEQHYLDSMIGPLPETAHRYRERSPIFHADRIEDPVAIFQGEDDRVVPVEQAETIVEALRRNGVPHEYHLYSGEGHGWRKAETIESFYQSLEAFLKQYVLFA
ncbi:MAG: S9 family peptidase [Chloroflexota bacterium]|nr:S9 family peptidase [Chloroflexota bacterium]